MFVPVVLVVALLTFLGWMAYSGSWENEALINAVAVLVIASVCSGLGYANSHHGWNRVAARQGILIKDAEALEISYSVTVVAFDKTGTSPKESHPGQR